MTYIVLAVLIGIVALISLISLLLSKGKLEKLKARLANMDSESSDSEDYLSRGEREKVLNLSKKGVSLSTAALAGSLALLLILTLVFSFARVEARQIGIETSMGKYSRTLDQGWQLKYPWASVETFSTQLQRTELDAPVAFASSGGGTQSVTAQWKITDDRAEDLWMRYKEFDNVDFMLIQPAAKQAVGDVLAGYTPAESRAEGAGEKIRAEVEKKMGKNLERYGVELDSVAMPPTQLDQTAQNAYNRVVEARANVERAKEDVERAKLDAEANRLRNKDLSKENLIDQCLTVSNNWDTNKNGPLPASWNCLSGGNTQLVTPTK